MVRSEEIATALTEAWLRTGTPKGPKEVADFYCALYDALQENNISKPDESQGKISKAESRDKVVQVACGGVLTLLAVIGILLAMFVK